MKPAVSIIVPSYNHAIYLHQRIDSIINQTFQDFEIILLDDASTDDSAIILKEYQHHGKVSQLVINETNSGSPFIQWAKGIKMAKSEYVWIAESDDFANENFLKKCVELLNSDESIGLVHTGINHVDINNQVVKRDDSYLDSIWNQSRVMEGKLLMDKFIDRCIIQNTSAVVFRRKLLDTIPEVYAKMKIRGDHFMWIAIAIQCQVAYINDKLSSFRWHDNSTRGRKSIACERQRVMEKVIVLNYLNSVATLNREKFVRHRNRLVSSWINLSPGIAKLSFQFWFTIDVNPVLLLQRWIGSWLSKPA